MKQFFVILNVVLGFFLAGMTVFNLSGSGKEKEEFSVKKTAAKNHEKKNKKLVKKQKEKIVLDKKSLNLCRN